MTAAAGRRTWLLAAVAALAAGIAIVTYATHAFASLELSSVDARFALRGASGAPGAVTVVAIDENTLNGLQRNFPFPRRLEAAVIDNLRRAGARAIGLDIEFIHPTDARDDNALAEAIQRARGTVLGTSEVGPGGRTMIFGGGGILQQLGAQAGNAAVELDSDGVLRREAYSLQGLRTFAVVLAEAATHRPVPAADFPGGFAPVDFAGPPGTVHQLSFIDVLRGHFSAGLVRNHVIVIGVTAPAYQDLHDTAVSGGTPMSGAEFQAQALASVLRGNPLRNASGTIDLLLIVLLALSIPALAIRLTTWRGLAVALVLGVGYLIATQLAFAGGTILSVVYPMLALILAAVGTLAVSLRVEQRARASLEQSVGVSDFFISYRREESGWPARILRDELTKRFGPDSVFMDLDSIDPGAHWATRIREAIAGCGAVLVLIGPRWVDARGPDGSRRLDDPEDWVRLEVEAALADPTIAVVPILLDGASMPGAEQLPASMQALSERNAITLRAEQWSSAVDQLVSSIQRGRVREHFASTRRAAV